MPETFQRQSGVVLIASLMVAMMLFATITVVLNFSVSESEVLDRRLDELEAFYLAEGAIEAAKFEIASNIDAAADGLGSLTGSNTKGSYTVAAVEIAGIYELTSTGTASGGSVITLETTIELKYETTFPGAAISFVGDLGATNINFQFDNDLILHGGTGPALSFSDSGVYSTIGQQFVDAIALGNFPAGNLVGDVTSPFTSTIDSVERQLAIDESTPSSSLADLDALYTELDLLADDLISQATTISSFSSSYGDADNPVILFCDDGDIENQTVTGYGTLIIGDRLRIKDATLNWNGDIFFIGNEMRTEDSTLNVNGNVIVLGDSTGQNEWRLRGGTQATINGNLFFGADWDASDAGVSLDVEAGGGLTVNGVLTMMGREIAIQTDGDATNSIVINGILQIAVPDDGTESSIEMDFDGGFEVYTDTTMIQNGTQLLHDLGVEYDLLPEVSTIVTGGEVKTHKWKKQTGGGAAGTGGKFNNANGQGNGNGA